ncbi:hypothetical protein [Rickettsia endosymbiont of Orchestes rusci]|uniref:hypothetical protein n=1 Tax=Rickettsia endosymbiont of Orchestes rusci TaxID=3066250 RepID=UPI00313BEFA4
MDVWEAAARQAYADSPSISGLWDPENLKHLSDPEFADIQQLGAAGYFDKKRITKEEFTADYKDSGLEYDANFTKEKIDDILERRKQQEINEYIISRGKGGVVEAIGKFGVEVVASNLSPINIAASFMPIGGQAKWAVAAFKYGGLKTGLVKGFIGGAIGQAAIEPFLYKERNFEQREYSLKDSAINILQSGLFGSALHGLGYSAKYLKNRYFATSETLAPEIKTGHAVVDSQFKANIQAVLNESDPGQLSTVPLSGSTLHQLQAAKLELTLKADRHFPEYFNQYKKVAILEQNLHEKFYTDNNIKAVPSHLKAMLQNEQAKLELLKEQYVNEPAFLEYLNKAGELDKAIIVNLRKEQFDLKGYNLSIEDLYIARSQLNEGKHINLDNPENAESFYEGGSKVDDKIVNTETTSLPEQLASLENDIAALPQEYIAEYNKERITDEETIRLADEAITKIKQNAKKKDIEPLIKTLSVIDEELAGELISIYKNHIGEKKLSKLERDKTLDTISINLRSKKFLQRRNTALNLIKLADSESFVRRFTNKIKGIFEYLKQVDLRQNAVEREILHGFIHDLEKAKLVEIYRDKNFEQAIAQELWNITHPDKIDSGSNQAKAAAGIIHKWHTYAANRANLGGAHINFLPGYITKRTHNAEKLRKAGFNKWLEFITPLLDLKKTGEVDFRQIYNNLATATHLKDLEEHLSTPFSKNIPGSNGANIAKVVSANRELRFKTAEAELKYLYEFGNYSKPNIVDKVLSPLLPERSFLAESIVSDLTKMGRAIGIMEVMGSKPQEMLTSLRNCFIRELQEKATVNHGFFSQLKTLKRAGKFENQLQLMLGVRPEIPLVDSILGNYRSLKCMSSLGSTLISSFPDIATFITELQNNGVPLLESYASSLKILTGAFNPKEKKEFGRLLGITVDSLLGGNYSRLGAEGAVAGSIAKATTAFFKLNLMEPWDNNLKSTMGILLSHNLAKKISTAKSFNEIRQNLQTLLTRYGIGESNWHLYKNLIQSVKGNQYIIPDINLLPDNIIDIHLKAQGKIVNELNRTRLKQDLTNNLQRYFIDRVDTAIPTPHTAEQSAMQLAGLGVKPGSPMAAVIKCLMQFKTFPYSYVIRPLKAVTIDQIPIHEQRGYGLFDKGTWQDVAKTMRNPTTLKIFPQLMLGTTGLGYLSLNAGRLLKGQEPVGLNEEGVFAASLMKGGGLGLYGDFIFGEYDRYGHNLVESLAGPIGGDLIDIGKIYTMAKNGDPKAQELLTRMLKRNVPGRNLFYLTPALFMVENYLK